MAEKKKKISKAIIKERSSVTIESNLPKLPAPDTPKIFNGVPVGEEKRERLTIDHLPKVKTINCENLVYVVHYNRRYHVDSTTRTNLLDLKKEKKGGAAVHLCEEGTDRSMEDFCKENKIGYTFLYNDYFSDRPWVCGLMRMKFKGQYCVFCQANIKHPTGFILPKEGEVIVPYKKIFQIGTLPNKFPQTYELPVIYRPAGVDPENLSMSVWPPYKEGEELKVVYQNNVIYQCAVYMRTKYEMQVRGLLDGTPTLFKKVAPHEQVEDKHNIVLSFLYLISYNQVETKMDRNRIHSICAISELLERNRGRVYFFGVGWADYNPALPLSENIWNKCGEDFNLVIYYRSTDHINECLTGIKTTTYNEMYAYEKVEREIEGTGFSYIVCHHTTENDYFAEKYKDIPFYHIPHCANEKVFRKRDVSKDYDFSLVGRTNAVYPLRERWAYEIIPMLEAQGYKCHIHNHPGYIIPSQKHRDIIEEYVDIINRSKVTLTCSSKYRYRLSKFAEIPLCGSVIASDLPSDGADFFRKFSIVVEPDEPAESICTKLVEGIKIWKNLEKLGREETLANSSQTHYAVQFLDVYRDYAEKDLCEHLIRRGDMREIDLLEVNRDNISRHSIWMGDADPPIKIPYQQDGLICKNPNTVKGKAERFYNRRSFAHEYTILKYLASMKMAPEIGKVVHIKELKTPGGVSRDVYGYEMADATTLRDGAFDMERLIQEDKLVLTEGAKGDLLKVDNLINGYCVDVRRTCWDMVRWRDTSTLYLIEGVNY
jgi:hypothetical protein